MRELLVISPNQNTIYRPVNGKLKTFLGEGICYMHGFNPISATSYCPDYFRRNRDKQTLQQWIEEHNVPTPQPTHNQP